MLWRVGKNTVHTTTYLRGKSRCLFSSITPLNIIACAGVAKKLITMDLKSYIPLFHSLIQIIIHNIISLLKCYRRFCSRFNKLVKFCNCQLTQVLPQKAQKLQKHLLPALKYNEKKYMSKDKRLFC